MFCLTIYFWGSYSIVLHNKLCIVIQPPCYRLFHWTVSASNALVYAYALILLLKPPTLAASLMFLNQCSCWFDTAWWRARLSPRRRLFALSVNLFGSGQLWEFLQVVVGSSLGMSMGPILPRGQAPPPALQQAYLEVMSQLLCAIQSEVAVDS